MFAKSSVLYHTRFSATKKISYYYSKLFPIQQSTIKPPNHIIIGNNNNNNSSSDHGNSVVESNNNNILIGGGVGGGREMVLYDVEIDKLNNFYSCTLFASVNPYKLLDTNIECTSDPFKRLEELNYYEKEEKAMVRRRPWHIACVVHGFKSKLRAMEFEYFWKNPLKTRSTIMEFYTQNMETTTTSSSGNDNDGEVQFLLEEEKRGFVKGQTRHLNVKNFQKFLQKNMYSKLKAQQQPHSQDWSEKDDADQRRYGAEDEHEERSSSSKSVNADLKLQFRIELLYHMLSNPKSPFSQCFDGLHVRFLYPQYHQMMTQYPVQNIPQRIHISQTPLPDTTIQTFRSLRIVDDFNKLEQQDKDDPFSFRKKEPLERRFFNYFRSH